MPDNYDLNTFEDESISPCIGGDCGKSVIVNNNDGNGDCCIPGPQGPAGPAGKTGPAGKQGDPGPSGRAPLIRCGCLPENAPDGGSGGPIQQECIDNITGKVVVHQNTVNYYTLKSTPNTFFQSNCNPGVPNTYCSYANISSPNTFSPPYGEFGGGNGLGPPSTSTNERNIVSWGYIGTGGVPNTNYTWKYGDFKKLLGLQGNNLTATANSGVLFTFMPTDSLFTGNGQIDLAGWKSLIDGSPSQELVDAFLYDFPECATDGSGAPPGPKNGQGGDICEGSNAGSGACSCEGCDDSNKLQSTDCSGIQAGDMFIDACNKIMYIAGEGGKFPSAGIPFGPEDTKPCPPKEECPNCPDCPPPNCDSCPCTCQEVQPPLPVAVCNCVTTINNLIGADCTCKSAPGQPPRCPKICPDGVSLWFQNESKECPCKETQTYVGCVDCAKTPTIICECPKGETAGCSKTETCESLGCNNNNNCTYPVDDGSGGTIFVCGCPPLSDGSCDFCPPPEVPEFPGSCLPSCAWIRQFTTCCNTSGVTPTLLIGE